MKVISHRGNLTGPNKATENDPRQIDHVLKTTKFDVEVDVWLIGNQLYLGHDEPQYPVEAVWLGDRWDRLWIHVKNLAALDWFHSTSIQCFNFFWHENDAYTMTNLGCLWVYPGKAYTSNCTLVHLGPDFKNHENVFGICTDYPLSYEN